MIVINKFTRYRFLILFLFGAVILFSANGSAFGQSIRGGTDTSSLKIIDKENSLRSELRFLTEKDASPVVMNIRDKQNTHTGGHYHAVDVSKYFESDESKGEEIKENSNTLIFEQDLLEQMTRETGKTISSSLQNHLKEIGDSNITEASFLLKDKINNNNRFLSTDKDSYGIELQQKYLINNFALGEDKFYPRQEFKPFWNENDQADDNVDNEANDMKFRWKPAIYQSLLMLGIQHGYAIGVQEKTQRALKEGNFFGDYIKSLRKSLRRWDDGNRFSTNYIAHPMQGAMTGFIYLQNNPRSKGQHFGKSKEYWNDRFKAFLWSTAWSTQFELGPISQSSIGNLGMHDKMGYVDLVITPTVGTAWLVVEEAIDRYFIRHIETKNQLIKYLVRTFLNPMRGAANLMRFKEPWYRDREFGQ